MNRSLTISVRDLLVALLTVIAVGQTLRAQAPPTASPSDTEPITTVFPHDETSAWWLSGQVNLIAQSHGSFPAAYSGPNSFKSTPEQTVSRVSTLYTGLRLPRGWEVFVDVEKDNAEFTSL